MIDSSGQVNFQITVYGVQYINMAESLPEKSVGTVLSNVSTENSLTLECAVCLQSCVHPAELPCGHVFCYLCIKGIVNRGRRCAMCRQDIPADYLDKPRLLKPVENEAESKGFDDGHSWFYEGHNGWWQYDERTSLELETAYQNGERCCELLVAGFLYVADFDSMLQYRRNDACKRRRIKRDLATTNKKGVAGLKLSKDATPSNSSNIVSNVLIPGMQNLHISNRPPDLTSQRVELTRNRRLSHQSSDQIQRDEPLPRRHSLVPLHPVSTEDSQSSLAGGVIDSDDSLYSRNLVLDDMIHNTLDWTIQQIESLQLQLSSDYDNLSQDVHHYETLQNAVSRRNAERRQLRRSPVSRLNRSLENELDASDRSTARSTFNRSEENVSSIGRNRFQWNENTSPRPDFRD